MINFSNLGNTPKNQKKLAVLGELSGKGPVLLSVGRLHSKLWVLSHLSLP
jgi:hypothetical protein